MQGFRLKSATRIKDKPSLFEEEDSDDGGNASNSADAMLMEDEDAGSRLQELGNEAASRQDWSLALRRWEEALRAGSKVPQVLHEQRSQAVRSAEEAVALAPTWADAHLSLARAQLAMGQVELGQASMRAALALDPDHKEATQEYEDLQRYLLAGEAFDGGTQMEGD
ncbi:hypothetical protein QBZ16_001505 [Prototheca wickerhamii]|uniref:Tetratricopeptide repeat protein 33 n=1 Tax=Prototheca wickerhamii TaxID=3111 RepID=A0AAD9MFZ1_PROWI|nr:hypothetical protein QBZ16_001505 [Prototheca wickerhamii]